jgi:hypothetical protein
MALIHLYDSFQILCLSLTAFCSSVSLQNDGREQWQQFKYLFLFHILISHATTME